LRAWRRVTIDGSPRAALPGLSFVSMLAAGPDTFQVTKAHGPSA
jgi:hypothetical protein